MNPLHTLIVRAVISIVLIAGYGIVLWLVLQPGADFTPAAEKLATFVLGALTTALVTVVGFWFGSTQGSADKTAALGR